MEPGASTFTEDLRVAIADRAQRRMRRRLRIVIIAGSFFIVGALLDHLIPPAAFVFLANGLSALLGSFSG